MTGFGGGWRKRMYCRAGIRLLPSTTLVVVVAAVLIPIATSASETPAFASANAVIPDSAFGSFSSVQFPANDDGSWPCGGGNAAVPCTGSETGPAPFPFGFNVNFYGTNYSGAYVNNNGNITFGTYLSQYTPFGLPETGTVIIAPFFADVDTRVGNVVEIGTGTLGGHKAVVVNWPGVGCFSEIDSVTNNFQLVLIDRPDLGTGPNGDDFQIEFNYNSIQWDAGTASGGNSNCSSAPNSDSAVVGFSTGTTTPGDTYQFPGSQTSGAFLDSNATTGLIKNSMNSDSSSAVPASSLVVPGRYIFNVNNGVPTGFGPTVATVSPNSGSVGGGTTVTISGSGFVGVTEVNFGSAAAESFTVNSSDSITAVTPPGPPGNVDVTVSAGTLSSPVTQSDRFTYLVLGGLTGAATSFTVTQSEWQFMQTLATFHEPAAGPFLAGGFVAWIDWGDGYFPYEKVNVTGPPGNQFNATYELRPTSGAQSIPHTFCSPGTFHFNVVVAELNGNRSAILPGTISVQPESMGTANCNWGDLLIAQGPSATGPGSLQGGGCSATLVKSTTGLVAITAAHCFEVNSDGSLVTPIFMGFIPDVQPVNGLYGQVPFGIWTSQSAFVDPLYGISGANKAFDFAFVRLSGSCMSALPSQAVDRAQCPNSGLTLQQVTGGVTIDWQASYHGPWRAYDPGDGGHPDCNGPASSDNNFPYQPDSYELGPCLMNDNNSGVSVAVSGAPWFETGMGFKVLGSVISGAESGCGFLNVTKPCIRGTDLNTSDGSDAHSIFTEADS